MEVIPDLQVAKLERTRSLYTEYLGLSTEEFNLGWVARYTSPETGARLQILASDAATLAVPVVSVKVEDIDAAYEEAQRRSY